MYKHILRRLFALILVLVNFVFVVPVVQAQLVDETGVKVDEYFRPNDSGNPLGGFVPCGNLVTDIKTEEVNGVLKQSGGKLLYPCNFNYFIMLINKMVDFILFYLAVPIAAIMFCYAGFQLLFSGGNSEKMSKAKSIFVNVALGLVLAAGAWLIIHTVSEILGYNGSWIGF